MNEETIKLGKPEGNPEKTETTLRFHSKAEIADCIRALGPFTDPKAPHDWALDKIKELTKLL